MKPLPPNLRGFPFRTAPDRLEWLANQAKKQEDIIPLYKAWLFTHPDAVRDVLVTHGKKFMKSPAQRWLKITLGNGLLTSEGEQHQRQRRLIQPSLHPGRLAGYAEQMTRRASDVSKNWKDGDQIELHKEMMHLTLRIVAEALFGAEIGEEADIISHAMDQNIAAFQRVNRPFGWLYAILPTPATFRYVFARKKLVDTLKKIIAQRRAEKNVQRDDLLSRLLAAQDPEGGGGMTEKLLVDECVTLFAAGHETTANALTFTFWLLSQHPEIEKRLMEEVELVLGSRAVPELKDLEALPYARQVVAESMRLYPPAWIIGRQAAEDAEIQGYHVPKGSVILVSQWLTHRDPRWWPDPLRFNPDRFAQDQSAHPRWAYFPFGAGTRACVGESFAWAEATLVMLTLLRGWHFKALKDGIPSLDAGVTLRPKTEIEMIVRKRSPAVAPAREPALTA